MVSNRFAQPVRVVPHAGYHPKEFAAAIRSTLATVRYDLRGVDNGQTIFSREIATQAHFNGGNAAKRAKGTARDAIRST